MVSVAETERRMLLCQAYLCGCMKTTMSGKLG